MEVSSAHYLYLTNIIWSNTGIHTWGDVGVVSSCKLHTSHVPCSMLPGLPNHRVVYCSSVCRSYVVRRWSTASQYRRAVVLFWHNAPWKQWVNAQRIKYNNCLHSTRQRDYNDEANRAGRLHLFWYLYISNWTGTQRERYLTSIVSRCGESRQSHRAWSCQPGWINTLPRERTVEYKCFYRSWIYIKKAWGIQ